MPLKFNTIEKLRDHMLETLEKLSNKKIDVDEVSIIAKGIESINSSLKLQLAYWHMRGETPLIPFIENGAKTVTPLIEHKKNK